MSAWTAPWLGWLWWVFVGAAALTIVGMAVNRLLLPTITGWSLGRALFGIAVRTRDGAPVGVLRLVGRDLAHLLDTAALFIGWLWPLWDRRHRTFADLLLRTEVHDVERPQRDVRRLTAIVLVVATLMCALAVGLSYLDGVSAGARGRHCAPADRRPRPQDRRTTAQLRRKSHCSRTFRTRSR